MKKLPLLIIAFIFVLASVLYTNHLAAELSLEEQKKVELWAEATRQFILAEPGADIEFISTIIEGNTTIPVYMTDENGQYMLSRNIRLPKRLKKEGMELEQQAYYQKQIDNLREKTQPIEVRLAENHVQYIFYDQSTTIQALQLLPYLQFLLLLVFVGIAIVTIRASHRAEENSVWVGLSRETAHQLGTPISSLTAWNELLQVQYPDNSAFEEVHKDIQRLTTITERFSKIGSRPTLKPCAVIDVVQEAMQYMQTRTSARIRYVMNNRATSNRLVLLNPELFTWVIENLIRNSVDAMNGEGLICITISNDKTSYMIDVTDTGRGIERRRWRKVFLPGHTTKLRGWGLGLSLARRIVEDYHHGEIFVKESAIGGGTTFRIRLRKL